jgi:hypothetical protein
MTMALHTGNESQTVDDFTRKKLGRGKTEAQTGTSHHSKLYTFPNPKDLKYGDFGKQVLYTVVLQTMQEEK